MVKVFDLYEYNESDNVHETIEKNKKTRQVLSEMENYIRDFKIEGENELKYPEYEDSYSYIYTDELIRDTDNYRGLKEGIEGVVFSTRDGFVIKIDKPSSSKDISSIKKYLNIAKSVNKINKEQKENGNRKNYDIGPTIFDIKACPFVRLYDRDDKSIRVRVIDFCLIVRMKFYQSDEDLERMITLERGNHNKWKTLTNVQKNGIIEQILMNIALLNSEFISHCDLHFGNMLVVYNPSFKERVYQYKNKVNGLLITQTIKTDGYYIVFVDIGGFSSYKCDQSSCRAQIGTQTRMFDPIYISNSSHYDSISIGRIIGTINDIQDPGKLFDILKNIMQKYESDCISYEIAIRTRYDDKKSINSCNDIEKSSLINNISDHMVETMMKKIKERQEKLEVEEEAEAGPSSDTSGLRTMNITELKTIARDMKIPNYSSYRTETKDALISKILESRYRMKNRLNKSKRKTSKRKTSKRKTSKRKTSKRKISKRKSTRKTSKRR